MFAQKLLKNVLWIDENHKEPVAFLLLEPSFDWQRDTDCQITWWLRQCCFFEQLLIPVIKTYYAESFSRLEIGVYNYMFSDAI